MTITSVAIYLVFLVVGLAVGERIRVHRAKRVQAREDALRASILKALQTGTRVQL